MATFDSGKDFLIDLLRRIERGEIQLPDFQRGWVWDDEHIRSVLASVARSFPIGAVMLLETGGEVRFAPRLVQGVELKAGVRGEPQLLILDGQQRLTSLYQATLMGKVVVTQDAKRRKLRRWYYIDMRRAVDTPDEIEEAIRALPEDRQVRNFRGEVEKDYSTPEREYASCLFPFAAIFNPSGWRRGFNEHWRDRDPAMRDLFDRFEEAVIEPFRLYQLPTITLRRTTSKEAVCQVFEKVNTGGVSLDAFELLTATYAAQNYRLRDDWLGSAERGVEGRHQRLVRRPVLTGIEATDFLQCVALLDTLERRARDLAAGATAEQAAAISCKRSTILNLGLDAYRRWAPAAEAGFERAARFLFRQKVFAARDLPYRTQLVPLAAILTRLGERWEDDGIGRQLARWYWCGVLGELYGSAVESRFARDVPEVLGWIDGGPLPTTVEEANFRPGRLATLTTRNSAAYKGIHALLMREGGLDLRTGVPIEEQTYFDDSIDIHHIFPRAWCEQNGILRSRYDVIVNKTAISARTNRLIGGRAPSAYLKSLRERAGINASRMGAMLRTHLIEPEHLERDDFEGFYRAREQALLRLIADAMGATLREDCSDPTATDTAEFDEAA